MNLGHEEKIIPVLFVQDEDVVNYKKTSMVIGMPYCDGKCWKDLNKEDPGKYDWSLCHNGTLMTDHKIININIDNLIRRYINNPLTHAIVFAGMEPLMNAREIMSFISRLRGYFISDDDIVIYTGYREDEKPSIDFIDQIKRLDYKNIIIKFGRYIPNQEKHKDPILEVELASMNQYAKIIN